ncbi:MAG: sulfite oxidase heme-binding subunit YedZ [Magnetovibrionaceae bacterium]
MAWPNDRTLRFVLKPLVFALALLPLGLLVWQVFTGQLGANPVEAMTRSLGDWALRFLLLTLALSPLKTLTGWAGWVRFRRMIGLFAFFYAVLHVSNYVVVDHYGDLAVIWSDILKRLYITVGMASLVILLALAATSPKVAIKKLGGRRWQKVHRFVYPAAILAVVHFYMMIRADKTEAVIYGIILAGLLAFRFKPKQARKRPA